MTNAHRSIPTEEQVLLVHAYSDGELDPANALAVGRQIAADPLLAAELDHVKALNQVIRDRVPRLTPPPHLQARIEAAVGLNRRPMPRTWQAMAASIVLAAALGSGSTWVVLRQSTDDHISQATVDAHVRGLMASRPTDIDSSDSHTVKPWFNGRIPQAPRVVDLSQAGFPLVGARIDVIGTAPVPTLVYGHRRHIISLSAVPDASNIGAASAQHVINGYNVVSWHENGISYRAISDLAAGELEQFAAFFTGAPASH
jgi:anti-sigma factor RsiW